MVTYVLGNSIKKRAYFSKMNTDTEIYVDDMRVACDVIRRGTYCYAVEGRPFKNMRVGDYVAYSRSMFDGEIRNVKHIKKLLKSVGYGKSLHKKLGKVKEGDYLKVLLASKLKPTTRAVCFNLDLWRYNAKNLRRINKLANSLARFSICFLVSDMRFCKAGGDVLYLTSSHDLVLLDGEFKRKRTSKRKVTALVKSMNVAKQNV